MKLAKKPGLWLGGMLTASFMAAFSLPVHTQAAALASTYTPAKNAEPQLADIPYSEFIKDIKKSPQASTIVISGDTAEASTDSGKIKTTIPPNENIVQRLEGTSAVISAIEPKNLWPLLSFLGTIGIIAASILFVRRNVGGGSSLSKPKSGTFNIAPESPYTSKRVTFDDVEGIDEAKDDLKEIVDFLKNPSKYRALGAKIPKGVLLVGSPGTGKTLIARALAGEAKVPFFNMAGSDFVEMFVGVGAARVRELFIKGKEHAPCIIFIDEIDAVGRHRSPGGHGGGNDEWESTLNALLVEMDGFTGLENVIVIAATNRPEILDKALTRPGRFDRQIVVPNPDINGRERILKVHTKAIPLHPDVSHRVIARGTPGFSGADLANLANEAALMAARLGKKTVCMLHFDRAKDKVIMGAARKLVMSEAEKNMTAYHEAGHALIALTQPECDPVHKATIVPHGRALGMVVSLPEADRLSMSKAKAKAQLAMAMGGRAAEEIIFGPDQVSNGAGGDIDMATNLAYTMVTQWGMSDKIGMIKSPEGQPLDAETKAEIKFLIDEAYAKAKSDLLERRDILHRFAKNLLDRETLSGEELKTLMEGDLSAEPEVRSISENAVAAMQRPTAHPDCVCEHKKSPPRPAPGGLAPAPA
jgi:cell division protease FtsH